MHHELNHYVCGREDHSKKFLDNRRKMGYEWSDYESRRFVEGWTREKLEGRLYSRCSTGKDGQVVETYYTRKRPEWKHFEELLYDVPHHGHTFRSLRLSKELSLRDVARAMSTTATHIKSIESSRSAGYPETPNDSLALAKTPEEIEKHDWFLKRLFYYLARAEYKAA